jgi:hypothetical protein
VHSILGKAAHGAAAKHTPRRPGVCGQVSCRITITRMMMTSTPMIVPIIPRFM